VREHCSGDERGILDAHAVMKLVALAEPTQNRDGVFDARFFN
jgi:hypothetical protein